MSAPNPALCADRDGTTRVRLAHARMTAQEARLLAFELLTVADLADHANGVDPKAGPFVPATPEGLDGEAGTR